MTHHAQHKQGERGQGEADADQHRVQPGTWRLGAGPGFRSGRGGLFGFGPGALLRSGGEIGLQLGKLLPLGIDRLPRERDLAVEIIEPREQFGALPVDPLDLGHGHGHLVLQLFDAQVEVRQTFRLRGGAAGPAGLRVLLRERRIGVGKASREGQQRARQEKSPKIHLLTQNKTRPRLDSVSAISTPQAIFPQSARCSARRPCEYYRPLSRD